MSNPLAAILGEEVSKREGISTNPANGDSNMSEHAAADPQPQGGIVGSMAIADDDSDDDSDAEQEHSSSTMPANIL